MKKNKSFLNGILLSSVLILLLTISITENTFQKAFNGKLQQAAAINSVSVENIYNISPSKDVPGMFDFNYAFEKTPTFKKGEKAFDLPIATFDDEKARAILEKEYGMSYVDFGPIRDAWNYPVKPNAFMKADEKKESTKKQSFLNSLKTNKALAMDEDTDNLGVYNCRANTSVTGYFKAYFEDVALGTNIGYDDPTYGEGRREEVCQVLQDMSELLMINTTTVTPDILFSRSDTPIPPGALAAASSYSGYYSLNPDNGSLHKHIITREDPTPGPGNFDAIVITNFNGVNWDIDSSLNSNTYDMYSVMWHEIMHALGFRGLLPAVISETEVEHRHGTFDYHTYKDESLQNRFITVITNILNVPIGAPSPWFTTNQVVYQGVKNTLNSTPDEVRSVYSPSSWQQGSSLSHFDMNRDGETYIMHPSIGTNTEREIHQGEKEVLCHLGYMVEGECEELTPWAKDDLVVLNGTEAVCIDLLMNDTGYGASYLRVNTLEPTSIQPGDLIEYFTGLNCSGGTQNNPFGAISIRLTPINNSAVRVFTYTNINVYMDSNRISFPARIITMPSCESVTDPDEYICNGDFGVAIPNISLSYLYSQVICDPLWETAPGGNFVLNVCNFFGTPDVIHGDSSSGFASLSSPAPINTNFPYFRGISHESAVMKLKEPLIPGQEYVLSFDYALSLSMNSSNLKFFILTNPPVPPNLFDTQPQPISDPNQQILNENIDNLNPWTWNTIEQNFIPDNEYEFLVFYSDYIMNTGGPFGPSCCNNLFDNLSIRPADAPPPPPAPVSTGSITGTIYQDLNQNGSQSSNESSLSGISVSLFEQGNNTPLQTVTSQNIPNLGKYTFNNLPDGTYYVALQGESIYPSITEPQTNNFLSGYSHARQVTVSNGQISENNNFGVGLNNASTNIGIKKDLIDSYISLFDRYITWRVLVYNTGPGLGTNIRVGDILPEDINYHIQNSQNDNITYNQNEGVITVTSLEPNTYTYVDITTRVPKRACGRKTNVATLISLDQDDTNSQDNSASKTFVLDPCPKPGGDFPAVVK